MHKKKLLIVAVVVIVTLTFFSFDSIEENAHSRKPVQQTISKMRPEFSLPDLQGKTRNIKEWDNNYIVLNFWATWCPPCREEIPEFIALQKEYATSNLQFIGVAIDDDVSVNQFALEMGINYPNLIAEMQGIELARQYGNSMGALPFSVIINPEGQLIAQQIGLLERSKILATTQLSKD
jgi:thiol-disulfide isomerase/thioredoxin